MDGCVIGKVGVGDEAVSGKSPEREEGEFGIDGSGIGTKLGHQGFGSQNGGVFCDFERHSTHEDHDPDRIFLGLLNGDIVRKTKDGIWKNRLDTFQPAAGDEDFIERLANFSFEFNSGDFFGDRAVDSQQAIRGNRSGFCVGFGQGLGIGIGLVVNDNGMSGEIRALGICRRGSFSHSHLG